ncbi:hypothetical protein HQ585_08290 [candidate division KSB1 bacterium]|nr:hypothetical protein [candidate division KSB1 bacterium]
MILRKTIVFLLFWAAGLHAQSVYLPLDHWAYDFMDRMETRGFLQHIRNGSKPFTRERCSQIIQLLDEEAQTSPERFSDIEKQMIERLKGEFFAELHSQDVSIQSKEKEPHFYDRNFKQGSVSIDALMGYSYTGRTADAQTSERKIHKGYYGAAIRGNVGPLGFYSDNRIYSEWGSRKYLQRYDASEGYPLSTSRDSSRAIWDVSDSYLTFGFKSIHLQWGRDNVQWGPLRKSGLMLSGSAPSFDLVKLHFDLGPSTFTWLHGELRSDYSHKWIAAHRLELSLSNTLDIGLQEVVIYGRRGLETAYLNPILPYLVAEHTLDDRDNMSLGLDFDFHYWNNLKFTGEFFIDDLFAPWEIFDDFWGNKLAFGLGASWVNPFGLDDTELSLEYMRIEPFVYTHDDSVNVFEHYASGLGSNLQPNSDRFRIEANHRFSLQLQATGIVSVSRHGNGNRRTPHKTEDGETKSFLGRTVERVAKSGCEVQWEPVRDLRFGVSAFYCAVQNSELIVEDDRAWTEGFISVNWNW